MTGQALAIYAASALMLALLALTVGQVFSSRPSRSVPSWLFFLLVFSSVLVLRWPSISWLWELSADESQMLAQGMRFLVHHVPWRDVDGTTSGPLNSLALSLPIYLRAPASWQTGRIVFLTFEILTLLFLYLSLRCFGTRSEVQFALMPTIFFYAFAVKPDFTHYSSESLSVALLAAGIYLLSREWTAVQPSKTRWLLLGLLMGSVPFAKLQASPLALFLVAVGFAMLVLRHRQADKLPAVGWPEAAALCFGGLVMPALILGIVIDHGAFEAFWKSYILNSGSYATQETLLKKARYLAFILLTKSDFRFYFFSGVGAMLLLLIAWRARVTGLPGKILHPLLVIIATGALTLFCFFVAGKAYYHYTLLLVPSMGMFFGLVFLAGKTLLTDEGAPASKISVKYARWLAAFSLLAIGFQSYKTVLSVSELKHYARQPPPMSLASQSIRAVKRPGDTMSVWGWTPSYYVETGIMPATRDAIGHYIISSGPNQDYFKRRYLNDLRESKPAFFVDAIAADNFRWYWTLADTHESFPELARFIDDNYTLWRSISPTDQTEPGHPVRIYILKQRFAELDHPPADSNSAADPPRPSQ